ncbi:hypothetical protein E2C01_087017 [Portunus trituberculatus]|uniref:Uncharacterized protein n=1 Tax=Portunus trituberculatus TaxID=210409 RepID=A0A5B7J2B1_PORTR|nr:hypothetical protein [Portunus trituberculatus]
MVGKNDECEEEPQAMHHGAENWHIDKYGKAPGLPTRRTFSGAPRRAATPPSHIPWPRGQQRKDECPVHLSLLAAAVGRAP